MTNNLRVQRAIMNITQAELANLIQVSRQTINSIEAGKYVPSTVLALKLVDIPAVLQTPMSYSAGTTLLLNIKVATALQVANPEKDL